MKKGNLLTSGERTFRVVAGFAFALVLALLYLPVLLMMVFSLQEDPRTEFPPTEITLQSYRKLFNTSDFSLFTIPGEPIIDYFPALRLSLVLGLLTAVLSTGLALTAALAFRTHFAGRRAAFYAICLGMVTPGVVLGLGVRLFADTIGLPAHWYTTGILVHVAWTMPFGFLVFLVFLNRFDRTIEEAAAVLGASPWHVFRTVTLPLLRPAVFGSIVFGFTLSFDETQRSALVLGTDQNLPRAMLSAATIRITPVMYSLGTLVMLVSLVLVVAYVFFFERERSRVRIESAANGPTP